MQQEAQIQQDSDLAVTAPTKTRDVGFRAVKRKQKAKAGRGFENPKTIIESILEDWDSLQNELTKLPEEEQDALKEHFNGIIEEKDNLGDLFFGDCSDFNASM